jgi:hypothetical protein
MVVWYFAFSRGAREFYGQRAAEPRDETPDDEDERGLIEQN